MKRTRWKLVALRLCRFFTYDLVTDEDYLKFLKLHTLYNRTVHFDTHFFYFCLLRFKMLPVSFRYYRNYEFFVLIPETLHSLLLLTDTLRLPDVFRLPIMCAKTLVSLGKPLLHWISFYANGCHFDIKLNMCFRGFRAFVLEFIYTAFSYHIILVLFV